VDMSKNTGEKVSLSFTMSCGPKTFQAYRKRASLILCATSVSSVPLWFFRERIYNHRDTEDTEVAQRKRI
jgi:hypothetical protein